MAGVAAERRPEHVGQASTRWRRRPNKRVLAKTQPLYGGASRATRCAPRARPQSHFAGEQLIDELAVAANMDPLAFRKQNIDLTDGPRRSASAGWRRWTRSAKMSSWKPKVAGLEPPQTGDIRTGRGVGVRHLREHRRSRWSPTSR